MNFERRLNKLERQTTASFPRVVWVNQDETPRQACERQGVEYRGPILVDTGIDKILFIGWQS